MPFRRRAVCQTPSGKATPFFVSSTKQLSLFCVKVMLAATAGFGALVGAASSQTLSTAPGYLPVATPAFSDVSLLSADPEHLATLPALDSNSSANAEPEPFTTTVPRPEQAETPDLTANPGRPALATSALLTPIGYLQVETGMLNAENSGQFSSRSAEEETFRYTVSPRLQFILADEPVVYSVDGDRLTQRGDLDGGAQFVLSPGHAARPTVSLGYIRLIRTGTADDLDIGGFSNSALAMASNDLGHYHIDANFFASEMKGPIRRVQFGQAVALSHPVTAKLSATAELRHYTEPLTGGQAVGVMGAGGYSLRPNLVFDLGLTHGFTGTSTRWQVACGVTYVLPHKMWSVSHARAAH